GGVLAVGIPYPLSCKFQGLGLPPKFSPSRKGRYRHRSCHQSCGLRAGRDAGASAHLFLGGGERDFNILAAVKRRLSVRNCKRGGAPREAQRAAIREKPRDYS